MLFSVIDTCNDNSMLAILTIIKQVILLIQIIVPILLLCFGAFSFIKLVKDPEEKNGLKKVYNQFLAAAIVFFVPVIVSVLMSVLGETTSLSNCWNSASNKITINNSFITINNQQKKTIVPDPNNYDPGKPSKGIEIAKLAVRVAPYASPDTTTVFGPWNFYDAGVSASCGGASSLPNPWYPPSKVDPKYKDFEKIMDAVINGSRPGNKAYGSCAQASGGIIRAVADPDFNTSHPEGQIQYLRNNQDKWKLVYTIKIGDKFDEVCQPGDLLVTDQIWTHTMIYVGNAVVRSKAEFKNSNGNIFQAGYDPCDHARYPRIDYMDKASVPFYVYRPTGTGNFKYSFIDYNAVLAS